MPADTVFRPAYTNSHALIIGINSYSKAPPLGYARNDAQVVSEYLIRKLSFPETHVSVLLDEAATRQAIMSAFLRLAGDEVERDDRVFVFFAGHGYTRTGRRGEVGYLVPVDGDPDDLSTLIRWDELTRNAELIPAKHVLFVMDACYGGLALARVVPRGSLRFLKDMLQRYSRQVLTAGKADEVVADAGGPRPGHSIFTGHFLDALDGAAASAEGTITANGVMSYVYDRVSKDPNSRQTPHFGFFDGDGDLVLCSPVLQTVASNEQADQDVLVEQPPEEIAVSPTDRLVLADDIKEYLSDPRFRIRLDDRVMSEVRTFLQETHPDHFPTNAPVSSELVAERLRQYERISSRLATTLLLLARWGNRDQRAVLSRAASRLVENNDLQGGQYVWLGLRWYPADLILYAAGISALSAEDYHNLAALFFVQVAGRISGQSQQQLLVAVVDGIQDATRVEAFKLLPGHERQFVPRSEYLFKTAQPLVEDALHLGRGYEELFDRYEIFVALVYADLTYDRRGRVWGPVGRFGWKASQGYGTDPLTRMIKEAKDAGEKWAPLQAGFFSGSLARFISIAEQYQAFMSQLGWH